MNLILDWYESSNDTEIDTGFFTSAESEQEEGFCVEGQSQADGGAQNHFAAPEIKRILACFASQRLPLAPKIPNLDFRAASSVPFLKAKSIQMVVPNNHLAAPEIKRIFGESFASQGLPGRPVWKFGGSPVSLDCKIVEYPDDVRDVL